MAYKLIPYITAGIIGASTWCSHSYAQGTPKPTGTSATDSSLLEQKVETGTKRRKDLGKPREVIDLDDYAKDNVIVGHIIKPEVMYVLSRGDATYKEPVLKKSFLSEIYKSVKKNQF